MDYEPQNLDDWFPRDVNGRPVMLPVRTAFRSPWQNGVAECWVGSVRRDMLDHVIVLNARHLRRLLCEYLDYYNNDRCHLALAKDAPASRPAEHRPCQNASVQAQRRLGPAAPAPCADATMDVPPWMASHPNASCVGFHSPESRTLPAARAGPSPRMEFWQGTGV